LIESGLLVLEKIFKNFQCTCIFTLSLLSPLGEGLSLHLNKLGSLLHKDDLCQVCFILAQWFWRRFLNDPTPFSYFCDYLPFEEDLALYLKKLEFPSTKENFY
jgi:hypothetical protein